MRVEIEPEGIEAIRLNLVAAQVQMHFGDVENVVLDVSGPKEDDWSMVREGSSLNVAARGVAERCVGLMNTKDQVAITLPQSRNDASLVLVADVAACDFQGSGSFLAVDAKVDASRFDMAARASEVDFALNAGKARLKVEDAGEIELTVAAGQLSAWIEGGAPSQLKLDVAAGAADLVVPAVPYHLVKQVAMGSLSTSIKDQATSPNTIDVNVAMGKASIEARVQPGPRL